MAVPTWCTITAARVAKDSRLTAHVANGEYEQADLETDAGEQIEDQAAVVAMAVRDAAAPYSWPFTLQQMALAMPEAGATEQGRALDDQKRTANMAVKELVIAALYRPLPGEEAAAASKAAADGRGEATIGTPRIGSAEWLIDQLVKDVTKTATAIQTQGSRKRSFGAIRTGRGDIAAADLDGGYCIVNSLSCDCD